MHRSGTSATARVLNLLGCKIPGPLVPAFHGNDFGHWEPQAVVDLHDAFLRAAGVNVNSVFGLEPSWFSSAEARAQVDATVDLLRRHLSDAPLHVIKDPRMGFFIPIWRDALDRIGVEAAFVLPFRDPAEVAASLARRQTHVYPDGVWPPGRGILLWLRYVLSAEHATRGAPRTFVAYDALLTDWRAEARRIGGQLTLTWPRDEGEAAPEIDAFLSRELKHETVGRRDAFPLAYAVFDQLTACAREAGAGAEVFTAALDSIDRASALFEPYVTELELRLGANPTLRSEFVDFLRRTNAEQDRRVDRAGLGDDGDIPAEHQEAHRIGLEAERRILATQKGELEAVNAALLGAARQVEASHRLELHDACAARGQAEEEVRDLAASLAKAQGAIAVGEEKFAALTADVERMSREESDRRKQLQAELEAELEDARNAEGRASVALLARTAELDALRHEVNARPPTPWVERVLMRMTKRPRGANRELDGSSS